MMARINRLESLLVSAMATNGQPMPKGAGIPDGASLTPALEIHGDSTPGSFKLQKKAEARDPAVGEMIQDFGSMKVDQAENSSIYLGGVHWVSIMSEVSSFLHTCHYTVDWLAD
jgi:hypothetical protein